MDLKKRNPAADLIRVLAFFLVVSVHFFKHNGFYANTVEGERMFVMMVMRAFFIICVPLFLMLSGYLLQRKQLEKKYYLRIIPIILTYVLASLFCLGYCVIFQDYDLTLRNTVLSILDYSAAPYAWYIEMYIGLFLLIPFLNIVYNTLPSQKHKIWLIVTFIILTALPSVLNVYDLKSFDWLALPSSSSKLNKTVPNWWQNIYPITYYYIGCYVKEYGLKINKALNAALIIICTVLSGAYCYWRSYKVGFIWGEWCSYESLVNIILTLLVFVFIINLNYDKFPNVLAKIVQKISGLTLCAYLVSWVFDDMLYPILSEKIPTATDRLEYYFVIVPTVFILSLFVSYLLSKIQLLIEKIFSLLVEMISNKKSKKTI